MARASFERELKRVQDELMALGDSVGNALIESVEILKKRDRVAARRLMAADCLINEARFAIENDALVLIARHQPMAIDLRSIAAILEIATELERIGDYAKGICKITLKMEQPLLKPLVDIPRMAVKARDMLGRSLKAFAERDVDLARAIPKEDDEMDALYDQIYRELITYILGDPRVIERASFLMWAAHNLERAADRTINICERVIFTVTGEMVEMDGCEADEESSDDVS
jgi:phosphate transport system protein